jgi:hypothetical protein
VPSRRHEAASPAIANNTTAKSYRNIVCSVGGNPDAATVTSPATNFLTEPGENPSYGDFVAIVKKKLVTPSPVNSTSVTNITKKLRITVIGVRHSSSISLLCRRKSAEGPFLSLGFP